MERRVQDMRDFDARTECLVLVWDASEGPEPEARLALSREDCTVWEVLLDGVVVARVPVASGLTPAQVALIERRAARAVGWLGDEAGSADGQDARAEIPFAQSAQSAYTPASAPPTGAG